MHGEGLILDLVGCIYDAAADPVLWPVFLERFAEAIGSAATALFFNDPARDVSVLANCRIDPAWWQSFAQHYSGIDPWAAGGFRLGLTSGDVATGEQLCPDRSLEKTEFYNDFLLPGDVSHQMCGVVVREERAVSVITTMRPSRRGPFGDEQTRLLQVLMPHLRRALQLHTRIVGLETKVGSMRDALDRIPAGFMLLDAGGKVLGLNRSAQEILDLNDGIAIGRDGIMTRRVEETNRLRGMIQAAMDTGSGNGCGSGGTMTVRRPSLKRPLQILVTPLRSRNSPFWHELAVVGVFVTDPEGQAEPRVNALRRLYGLTKAEARLASALMQGKNLEGAAAEFQLSRNTVRAQLRAIFGKTDSRRQGDLVRLLWNGLAQFRPE